MSADEPIEIDDSLYSRQRYVLGDEAMQKLGRASVLIIGLGGLGLEIAKNVILSGPKQVTVCDWRTLTFDDLGSHFYANENDIGSNRAEVSVIHLKELNPYVTVECSTLCPNDPNWYDLVRDFNCLVITDADYDLLCKANQFCRSTFVKLVHCDVRGVLGWLFCDFGGNFEICDLNGEEPREVFVGSITQSEEGVISSLDEQMHGLTDGNSVIFKEIQGMIELNDTIHEIKVLNPTQFSIGDTSQYGEYSSGGISSQIKISSFRSYDSFETQWDSPKILQCDLSHFERTPINHIIMQVLLEFQDDKNRMPHLEEANDLIELVKQKIASRSEAGLEPNIDLDSLDEEYLKKVFGSCQGCFSPLCSVIGAIAAQQVLTAVTGKFSPLDQWMYVDAAEVYGSDISANEITNDRYTSLVKCIGNSTLEKLKALRLFMIGCGAIGCELLKCFALLGCAVGENGELVITDNDLIEKSNLNRQFLFKPQHVQQSKSDIAAAVVMEMNEDIHISPYQLKVGKETETEPFNDGFYTSMDVIVNALDSVEARLYVDSRCVSNHRPLFESGTMAAKGHVQVILPYLTESYGSQRDPPETETPFCTLKSFPQKTEHVIQWARNKFESQFSVIAVLFNKFWSNTSPKTLLEKLQSGDEPENVRKAVKLLVNRPKCWFDCISRARLIYEKYFNHKANDLLHAFPEDHRLNDGSLFWQSPKRPPLPQNFSINNQHDLDFLVSTAKLLAMVYRIEINPEELHWNSILPLLEKVTVPNFVPKNKRIAIDESETVENTNNTDCSVIAIKLESWLEMTDDDMIEENMKPLEPINFEKDDDSHIDFIAATSNLRALMYRMETVDRYKIKRIAGKIIPAIATTTACVSGLVAIEIVKYIKHLPDLNLEVFNNSFLNLALPSLIFSEPGVVQKKKVAGQLFTNIWERVKVSGDDNFLLQDFIDLFTSTYKLDVSMVALENKPIYFNLIPAHQNRLQQRMIELCPPVNNSTYVDLSVFVDDPNEELDVTEDNEVLRARYFYC